MHVGSYLGLLHAAERQMAEALTTVAEHHSREPDVSQVCRQLARWSLAHARALSPFVKRYGERGSREPKALRRALFRGPRAGGFGLLRDLQDLFLLAQEVHVCWTVLHQAAAALRDEELLSLARTLIADTNRQISWIRTRIGTSAGQALVAA